MVWGLTPHEIHSLVGCSNVSSDMREMSGRAMQTPCLISKGQGRTGGSEVLLGPLLREMWQKLRDFWDAAAASVQGAVARIVEHKAEHNNCRMRAPRSDSEALSPTVSP